MIQTNNLTKVFDDFTAVDGVNLRVNTGEVLAMLGPNGAGKTTTVRMMTSILPPTQGSASIAGYDVVRHPEQVRAHVGVLTEQHGLYERMNGMDYLDFFGQVYHLDKTTRRQRSQSLMERFGLGDALDKRVGEFSKGMKQKLALVRALLHNPPVLLLDEPTSAMDPQSARQVREAILELQRDERTFLITTHNLTEAQLLADQIAIIRRGRIIAQGTIQQLEAQVVGVPQMQLTLNRLIDETLQHDLSHIIQIESIADQQIMYRTPDPTQDNPQIIRQCVEMGLGIISLTQITRTLEDIYLQIVQQDESQEPQPA